MMDQVRTAITRRVIALAVHGGDRYDAFTLKKRADALNEVIEQVPDVPERRRSPKTPKSRRRKA
jgi:hypothetical protein